MPEHDKYTIQNFEVAGCYDVDELRNVVCIMKERIEMLETELEDNRLEHEEDMNRLDD